jgi:hypothetical protein
MLVLKTYTLVSSVCLVNKIIALEYSINIYPLKNEK